MAGADLVVGTAGHVDHGKTSLVRQLTGVDLDTQPDERARGITIALGFVPLDLPDGRRVALVDVPGHERLVRTMVAGATGIDAALLCVSAQDGAMPQTREHLAILELLGVSDGVVALTKADLVDEELLELAIEDVADLVEGTFLEGRPVVPVSAVTGQGMDALVTALQALSPTRQATDGPFRLPVDRSFSRPGFGTIATGTAWSGRLEVGATVTLLPEGRTARVRGLQTHGEPAQAVRAGWRVAVNLSGVEVEQVSRGTLLTTGDVPVTHVLDVHVTMVPGAPTLEDGVGVRLLLGTAEAVGRVHLACDEDVLEAGRTYAAQLRLDAPVSALPGDRFVLRRTSPVETLGGGVVVDPWAPRLRRRRREAHGDEIDRLAAGEVGVWLERAGETGLPEAAWTHRSGGVALGRVLSGVRFHAGILERLEQVLLRELAAFHESFPLRRGAGRRELLRERLAHLPEKVFDALIDALAERGAVVLDGAVVRLPDFAVTLSDADAKLRERLLAAFHEAGLEGLTRKKVAAGFPEPAVEALLHLLEHEGALVAVPSVGWVLGASIEELRRALAAWFVDHDMLTAQDFKALSGQPRRTAIPLLEWMDRGGLTRRDGEGRRAGPALGQET